MRKFNTIQKRPYGRFCIVLTFVRWRISLFKVYNFCSFAFPDASGGIPTALGASGLNFDFNIPLCIYPDFCSQKSRTLDFDKSKSELTPYTRHRLLCLVPRKYFPLHLLPIAPEFKIR